MRKVFLQSNAKTPLLPLLRAYFKHLGCRRVATRALNVEYAGLEHAVRYVRAAACRTTDKFGSPNQQQKAKKNSW